MKKAILIFLGLMFGIASSSHTTPIYDSNVNSGKGAPVISSSPASRNFTLDEKASVFFESRRHISERKLGNINESTAMRWSPDKFNRLNWFNGSLDGGLHNYFSAIAMPPSQDPVESQSPAPEPGTILLLGTGLIGLAFLTQKGMKERLS